MLQVWDAKAQCFPPKKNKTLPSEQVLRYKREKGIYYLCFAVCISQTRFLPQRLATVWEMFQCNRLQGMNIPIIMNQQIMGFPQVLS